MSLFLRLLRPIREGRKQTPQTPQTPQTSLLRRDGAHAINAQLAVLILPRTQDKRALTTAERSVEALFQQLADGFCREHVFGQGTGPERGRTDAARVSAAGRPAQTRVSAKSIGKLLKQHLDEPVRSGERTLVLRSWEDKHSKLRVYGVRTITTT